MTDKPVTTLRSIKNFLAWWFEPQPMSEKQYWKLMEDYYYGED